MRPDYQWLIQGAQIDPESAPEYCMQNGCMLSSIYHEHILDMENRS